ncbi:HAD superfamily hydrolase (TIGR01509 family) [Natranaerovirga hydrolytica]|uniref:HAD superfamily hydrolase (TIGR01509 family) n=1 Tax=Natranaerovirga hydrolytica TaxID=680378 RepID=A0A4R1MJN5_9FIRM|nr:HAD family phosphatase [Natranaerovirga hydrolytica]TCK92717.1 HAD superfamily hydrolase (TIGR01509 family) [Natranaerovirga hydrolytica]
MIKAVIFDMDGLMFGTEKLALEGWLKASRQLNYPITEETVEMIRGKNENDSKKIFNTLFGKTVNYDKAKTIKDKYILDTVETYGVPIKKGLLELIKYLKEKNIKMAVATSTAEEKAKKLLELAQINNYFECCTFGDRVRKGKPNPEIYIKTMTQLKVLPNECVLLEDSPNGVIGGHSAGIKVFLVPDLSAPTQEIKEMASYICSDLLKAKESIEKLI